jgi:YggT family protein
MEEKQEQIRLAESRVVHEEPEGTKREESQVVVASGAPQDSRTEVVHKLAPARKVTETIYLIFGMVDVVLLMRLVFKLLPANPNAPFAAFSYGLSDFLLLPFRGIVAPTAVSAKSVFELSVVIAIVVYTLIAYGLGRLAAISLSRSVMYSHHEQNGGPSPGRNEMVLDTNDLRRR